MKQYERYLNGSGLENHSSDRTVQPLVCEECCRYLVSQDNQFVWQIKEHLRVAMTAAGIVLKGFCLLVVGFLVFMTMLFPNMIQTSANRPIETPRDRERRERKERERLERQEREEQERLEQELLAGTELEELNADADRLNKLGGKKVTARPEDRRYDDQLAREWNHRINKIGQVGGSAEEDVACLEKLATEGESHRRSLIERDRKRRSIAGKIDGKISELAKIESEIRHAEKDRDYDAVNRLIQQAWNIDADICRLEGEYRNT